MPKIIPSGSRYWKIAATAGCLSFLAFAGFEIKTCFSSVIIKEPTVKQLSLLLNRNDWIYLSTIVFLTSGTSASPPGDWNASANTIHCIGGASGGDSLFGAGGGGAYAAVTNQAWTGSVTIQIGAGAAIDVNGGDTFWNTSGTVLAAGSQLTQGGTTAASVGSVTFNGGNGDPITGVGAGGAGGPNGDGGSGFSDKGGSSSGAGDNGFGGAARTTNGNGNPGAEWTATLGGTAGSGGGAIQIPFGSAGRTGGLYGGGGAGITGVGAQGMIMYEYTPAAGGGRAAGFILSGLASNTGSNVIDG